MSNVSASTAVKSGLAVAFGMAAVWFGTHCGGGFATGNQEVNFYVKYGWYCIPVSIFAMILLGLSHRNALVLAKDYQTYDYKSYANALFHPYEKIFGIIFEFGYLMLILCGVSIAIAGAASLLTQVSSLPYGLAIVLVGAVLLFMTIFGAQLIINASVFMTIFLIIAVTAVMILGISAGWENFTHLWSIKETYGHNLGQALWSAIIYVGFQAFTVLPIISCAQDVKTTKECNQFFGLGLLLNGVMLLLACVMLFAFSPATLEQALPVHFVCMGLGISWFKAVYSLILFFALVSTGVTLVFSLVARFENVWPATGTFENLKVRRISISILSIAICTGISLFGLTNLVVKGYGSVGYIGLFIVLIPQLIIAPIKSRKKAQERALAISKEAA